MAAMSDRLSAALTADAGAVHDMLATLLPAVDGPEGRLFDAMRYATLNGGKRLRPFLVLTTASMFHVSRSASLRVAAAVEMVHSYSLVHDDLPAMDDDDLRRGVPTTHKKFDEATAILAGDGLLTRAFEVLGATATHADSSVRAQLVVDLAQAAGPHGMVGGQMIDILGDRAQAANDPANDTADVEAITRMHQMKTGRLIGFSCTAGATLGKAPAQLKQALQGYAHDLGLAFQIVDDLLDVEGDPAVTGKSRGKDAAAGKTTFVDLLGLDRARDQAAWLTDQAVRHLKPFDSEADLLRDVAGYVLARRS